MRNDFSEIRSALHAPDPRPVARPERPEHVEYVKGFLSHNPRELELVPVQGEWGLWDGPRYYYEGWRLTAVRAPWLELTRMSEEDMRMQVVRFLHATQRALSNRGVAKFALAKAIREFTTVNPGGHRVIPESDSSAWVLAQVLNRASEIIRGEGCFWWAKDRRAEFEASLKALALS